MGAHHSQRGTFLQIDFMARRKLWLALSGVVIVVSLGSLVARGLNLGIDFKGGVQITFQTPKPTPISEVRLETKAVGQADAVVQGRGQAYGSESYKSFQIRLKKLSSANLTKLNAALDQNVHATKSSVKSVSSSFGRQIAKSAIIAILFSLLVITLYIAVRFKGVAFAVPVIIALLHDLLITVGVYSLTGREVTEATVAAVLTVLGYSIYDTIIIFDRIRENIPIMRRASFATIVNVSLWETIRRSLATTFITLLPVDAQGLRVCTARRRHVGRVLIDLHRGAAPCLVEGARARVPTPQGEQIDRGLDERPRARRGRKGSVGRADARDTARRARGRAHRRRLRGEEGAAPPAAEVTSSWQSPVTPTRTSGCSRSSARAWTSCARSPRSSRPAGAATRYASARPRGAAFRTSRASSGS
jgi:preprotein translocase SecF subunit